MTLAQLRAELQGDGATVASEGDVQRYRENLIVGTLNDIAVVRGLTPATLAVQPLPLLGVWLKEHVKRDVDLEYVRDAVKVYKAAHGV